MENNTDLPWVEKYRPKDLNSIISHTNILNTLQNLINNNKLPHLIFYGPPGTGKTTTILACAKQIYGENYKSIILELGLITFNKEHACKKSSQSTSGRPNPKGFGRAHSARDS